MVLLPCGKCGCGSTCTCSPGQLIMLAPTGLITTGSGPYGDFYLAKTQCRIALDSWQAKARSAVTPGRASFSLSSVNPSCTTGMTEHPEQPEQYRWGVECAFGMLTHKSERSGAGGGFAYFNVSFQTNNSGTIDAQLTIHWEHHDDSEPPPKVAVYQRTISRCPTCENGDILSFGPSQYVCGTRYCGEDATYRFKGYCDCGTPKSRSGSGVGPDVQTYTFPAENRCIYLAGSIVDNATVVVTVSGSDVWNSGSITGSFGRCFNKPDGVTTVQVTVTGASGSSFSYTLTCDACPPVEVAPPCCREFDLPGCTGVAVRYCSPAPPLDTAECPNSSALPACDTGTCTSTEVFPARFPPHDCLNNLFRANGAWVTISGWSAYAGDTSGLTADEIALFDEVERKVNRSFNVPFACLGNRTVTIDLGVGEERDTEDCSGAHWFATVSVNLCARTASVNVSNLSCYDGTAISISLGNLTAITVPCNSWTACNCQQYSDDIPLVDGIYGGGTLTVSP